MEENKDIDLDKARDDKCIPIVRDLFNDMTTMFIPEDANIKIDFNPIVKSILQRTMDADTNIGQDNPYIFQLLLGMLSGLNKTVQTCELIPMDDVRYGKIATRMLEIVNKANVRVVNVTPEDVDADFASIKEELNQLFANEKLTLMELKYIMDNIFDWFNRVQDIFNRSIAQSSERAESKLFGIESMTDLTMAKLDKVLKS